MKEQYASIAGAHGFLPFKLGGIDTYVVGGPYRYFAEMQRVIRREVRGQFAGVCMAIELGRLPHSIFVPTRDFSIPEVSDMRKALMQSIALMASGKQLYVGCMGGIGRTGLFLAALAKIMGVDDPVAYVRSHYMPHAVETQEQQDFIRALPVEDISKWAKMIS